MTAPATLLGPITETERINSLDVLRGVALLGILLMNITGFGLIFMAYSDPTVQGGAEGWDLAVWVMNNVFFEGTMRAMFSMLFGGGMVIMTLRMESRGGGLEIADIYYRRTILLFIFGIVHGYLLLWAGDILYSYGLFGLFIFPFRKSAPSKLIVAAALLTIFGIGLQFYDYHKKLNNYALFQEAAKISPGAELPADVKKGKESWEAFAAEMKPSPEKIQEEVEGMHKGYLGLVLVLAPINRLAQTVFNYDYNPWDVLPMMLLGIALYKLKVITGELSYRSYLVMTLLGYGIGLSVNYYETMLQLNDGFSLQAILKAGLTYNIGRVGVAFGHIGLVMIFCKSNTLLFLRTALAAVGKMALTNYIMDSVICAFVFTGVGFSLFGKLQRHELYFVVLSIWLFQLIASPLWLKYFRFGPLEWMWRSLTYQKKQPFRIR